MGVTVERLYHLPIFQNNVRLLGGEKGLQREVQYVTIIDTPTIPLPEYTLADDNVFVLSTFSLYKDQPEMTREAVRNLANMNIAALGIKPFFHTEEIPEQLREIGDEFGLPFFLIDKKLPFRKLISAIDAEIIDSRINIMQRLNDQYAVLYDTILHGSSVDSFIEKVGKNLGRSCIGLSKAGEVMASYEAGGGARSSEFVSLAKHFVGSESFSTPPLSAAAAYFRYQNCYAFPCIVYNNIEGYFLVEEAGAISQESVVIAQQMASFISVKLLEKLLIVKSQQDMVSTVIDDILFRPNSNEVIKQRLNLLGFAADAYYRVLVFSQHSERRDNSFFAFTGICKTIAAGLVSMFPSLVSYHIDKDFVVILPLSASSKYLTDRQMACSLKHLLERLNIAEQVVVAYSRAQAELAQIADSYRNVKQIVHYAKLFPLQKHILSYEDFSPMRIVSNLMDTPERENIANTVIDPIRSYDTQHGAGLWETLETCIEADNLNTAAEMLHIHTSTLRYRMQKIAALTNQNFFSSGGKFVLTTAYIVYRLKQK